MLKFHQRLAALGLEATEPYGFALAGGYAISAHGMGDRPSMDVDLFTNRPNVELFAEAVTALKTLFLARGLNVEDQTMGPTFADMRVTDPETGEESDIQLGLNFREFPPAQLAVGPVLDSRDAVAGKMSALYSRGEVRDFIDIDTVLESGCFTKEDVLTLGDTQEAVPFDRKILAERFESIARQSAEEFARYDVPAPRRASIVARFRLWAAEITHPA